MPGVETPKTGEYVHVRVRDPGDFEEGTMRTVSITSGIKSVMGKLKGGDGSMTVQNWMFDKDKYTEAEARAWVEKHKSKSASELIFMYAEPVFFGEWDTAHINDLPDSSFAYIEPGGEKDDQGKTTPRSKRHLPYKNASGKPDPAHVRNALARLDQTDIPAAAKASAKRKLEAAANELGIGDSKAAAERFEFISSAPIFAEGGKVAKGEVLRTGSWIYKGDAMDIKREHLVQALENHKKHKRDVMLDYNHGSRIGTTPESQKRAGDLLDLELVDADGVSSLVGTFKPTEEAADYIGKDEYKYLSAEFEQDYFHPEDKKPIGFYLQAVALTNRPFIEGMAPMVLMSEAASKILAQMGNGYTGNISMQYECDEQHDVGDMMTKMMGTMKDAGMKVTGSSASKYKNSPSVEMYEECKAQEDKDGMLSETNTPRLAREYFICEVGSEAIKETA